MKISAMNWMQVEKYLETDDRCVLPLGSTEQHAYISLATDSILAERVAAEAAEPVGVPVFPALAYGITPYFMAFPGTVNVSLVTYERLLTDMLVSIRKHGFRRILVVNGHGGNRPARPVADAWAAKHDDTTLRWHDWWDAPGFKAAVREVDQDASHASWMETFPWTALDGVDAPEGPKPAVDLSGTDDLSLRQMRERLGDGSFGGYYTRSAEDTERIWRIGVEETRALLTDGW